MVDTLKESRRLANKVRFSEDKLRANENSRTFDNHSFNAHFISRDLPLSKELTPELAEVVQISCKRLKIPLEAVKAFVYASPELQAGCYSGNENDCIIRISSSLIDLLENDELSFVIGHELGHFLFSHGVIKLNIGDRSQEYLMQQRSQEVSVDRIGYLASESLDIAIKALMKTVSGLNSDYLRFDIGSYLGSLNKTSGSTFNHSHLSTHPTILFRCRALLWFSMKVRNIAEVEKLDTNEIVKLDKKILRDLNKYVDGPLRKHIKEVRHNVAMWKFINEATKDHTLDKKEQELFKEKFGEEKLIKMINFLENRSVSEIRSLVKEKLDTAKSELKSIIPLSYQEVLSEINQQHSKY